MRLLLLIGVAFFGVRASAGVLVSLFEEGKLSVGQSNILEDKKLTKGKPFHLFFAGKDYEIKVKSLTKTDWGTTEVSFIPVVGKKTKAVQYGMIDTSKFKVSKSKFEIFDGGGNVAGSSTYRSTDTLTVHRDGKKIAILRVSSNSVEGEWDQCTLEVEEITTKKKYSGAISPCDVRLFGDMDGDGWPEITVGSGNSAVTLIKLPFVNEIASNFGS